MNKITNPYYYANCLEDIDYYRDNLFEDTESFFFDEHGVCYTQDGKVLIDSFEILDTESYTVREGCEIICDGAFAQDWVYREDIEEREAANTLPKVDLILPDSVRIIGDNIIWRRTNITHLQLPAHLEHCEASQFYNVWDFSSASPRFIVKNRMLLEGDKLISILSHHLHEPAATFRIIGTRAFADSDITWVKLPDSVEVIEDNAFDGCTNLKAISLPQGLKKIGNYAFHSCYSLRKIVVPDSVEEIGEGIFTDCTHLTEVILPDKFAKMEEALFPNTNIPLIHEVVEPYYVQNNLLCLGNKVIALMKPQWQIIVPEGIEAIGAHAFANTKTRKIQLPSTLREISEYAFAYSNISSITLPEGIVSISKHTFSCCKFLRNIHLPESLISIGWEAFSGCLALTEIIFPEQVKNIADRAFAGCPNLQIVKYTTAEGLTDICPPKITFGGANVFDRWSRL